MSNNKYYVLDYERQKSLAEEKEWEITKIKKKGGLDRGENKPEYNAKQITECTLNFLSALRVLMRNS